MKVTLLEESFNFDFEDGNGPVPAHKHRQGGGTVADTATVSGDALVQPGAWIFGNAIVKSGAHIYAGKVFGDAIIGGDAEIEGSEAEVFGNARVMAGTVLGKVSGNSRMWGGSVDIGGALLGNSLIFTDLIDTVVTDHVESYSPKTSKVGGTPAIADAGVRPEFTIDPKYFKQYHFLKHLLTSMQSENLESITQKEVKNRYKKLFSRIKISAYFPAPKMVTADIEKLMSTIEDKHSNKLGYSTWRGPQKIVSKKQTVLQNDALESLLKKERQENRALELIYDYLITRFYISSHPATKDKTLSWARVIPYTVEEEKYLFVDEIQSDIFTGIKNLRDSPEFSDFLSKQKRLLTDVDGVPPEDITPESITEQIDLIIKALKFWPIRQYNIIKAYAKNNNFAKIVIINPKMKERISHLNAKAANIFYNTIPSKLNFNKETIEYPTGKEEEAYVWDLEQKKVFEKREQK